MENIDEQTTQEYEYATAKLVCDIWNESHVKQNKYVFIPYFISRSAMMGR
jgi:hypothetical protein